MQVGASNNQFTTFGARIPTGPNAPTSSQEGGIMRIRAGQPLPEGMDALLTPQDMKQLYDQGYLDVQRQFTTMESNEGIFTLTAKLAAAIVGPSRSVGAIQIDPLFLEMIKDPNAEVGFGFTRVRNETLRVLPSPAADPTPPEPRPVEVPEFVPGGSIAPETPNTTERTPNFTEPEEEPIVNNGQNIYSVAVTAGYVGQNDGQHFANTLDSTMEGTLRETFGFLSSMKPEQRDYVNAHIVVMFTGDMRHQNGYDQANGILNSGLNARTQWASKRIDTSHMTNNTEFEANQRTGSHQYHFFSTQHKNIPLSGEMLAQYAQVTGQADQDPGTLTGAYTNKTPPTMYDLSVTVNQTMTLGDEVNIPEAQNNQAQLQEKYGELYQTVTGQTLPENFDFKQASMEDLYTLQILSDGLALNQRDPSKGISPDQVSQVISNENGEITLQDTGAARTIISGVTGLPQGGENMTTSELVACHRMNLESNFIPPGGAGFQFTQADTDQVHEVIAGKYGTEKVNDGMRLDEDNFAQLSGSAFTHDHNLESEAASYNRSGPHRTTRSNEDLSRGTVASGMEKRELAQPDPVAQPILNKIEQAITADNMSAGYSRRGVDAQFQALENHINTLSEDNPNKAILSDELTRLRGIDRATRGQYVQVGSPSTGGSTVTPQALTQSITHNIGELGQPGLNQTSAQTGLDMIQRQISELPDNFPLESVNVDGFQKVSNGNETRVIPNNTSLEGFTPVEGPVTLADWTSLTPTAESLAQPLYSQDNLESTIRNNIDGLNTLLQDTQELPFSPEAANSLLDAINRDIEHLKQMPDTGETVTLLENKRNQLQTAVENKTQLYTRAQEVSGISRENNYISTLNDSLDGFGENVRAALADGKISQTEKDNMQTFVNDASDNTVAMLSSRGVGMTGTNAVQQLNSVTQADLINAGFKETEANNIMGTIDRLQFAQASLNITSEGIHTAGLYESVHQLNRRLDEFDDIEVVKTAFKSEMQTLAENRPQFENLMNAIFVRDGQSQISAETMNHLHSMAESGDFPMPPNLGFADRAQLGGGNGAYIEQGKNGEPVVLIARDLMSNSGAMRDVFFEEMFHHLENSLGLADSEGDEGQAGAAMMTELRHNPDADAARLKSVGDAVRMEASTIDPNVATINQEDAALTSVDYGTLNRNITDERGNVIAQAGSNIEFSTNATAPVQTQSSRPDGRASINYNQEPGVNLNVQGINPHQSYARGSTEIYNRGIGNDQSRRSENFDLSAPVRNNIQDPAVREQVDGLIKRMHAQGHSPEDIHRAAQEHLMNQHSYSQENAFNAVSLNTVSLAEEEPGKIANVMNTVMDNLGTGLMSLGKSMNDLAEIIKATVAKHFADVAMRLQQADPNKIAAYDVVYGEGGWHGHDTDVSRGRPDDYGRLQVNQTLDRTMNPNKAYSSNPNATPNYLQGEQAVNQQEANIRAALRLEEGEPTPTVPPSDEDLRERGLTDQEIGRVRKAYGAGQTAITSDVIQRTQQHHDGSISQGSMREKSPFTILRDPTQNLQRQ